MPYVDSTARDALDSAIHNLITAIKRVDPEAGLRLPGILNYTLTRVLCLGLTPDQWSYTTLNAAIGVLECAKLEFYRRLAAPYEDAKAQDNGDLMEYLPGAVTASDDDTNRPIMTRDWFES